MKKRFCSLAFLCLTLLFASCTKNNTLVVGLDESFPPLSFADASGAIIGYDIDLAHAVCDKLGLKLKTVPVTWAQREDALKAKKINCIWSGLTVTQEMRETLSCTPPYLYNAQVIVVQKDSSIKNIHDLAGSTIGVQTGSSSVNAIKQSADLQNISFKITEFPENLSALTALEDGHIDALVMDEIMANYIITRMGRNCRVLKQVLSQEEYGIAFRKDDEALRNRVWQALLDLRSDGTIRDIDEKWFGVGVSVVTPMN